MRLISDTQRTLVTWFKDKFRTRSRIEDSLVGYSMQYVNDHSVTRSSIKMF